MSAQIIRPHVLAVHRDVRNGVSVPDSLEARFPPEAKEDFIEAMRTDVRNNGAKWSPEVMRQGFEIMGFPSAWIDEAMQ